MMNKRTRATLAQPEQDTNIKESLTTGSCIACGNRMTGSPESFVVATAEVGVTAPEGYSPQQVEALHPHKGGDKTAPPLAEPEQEPVAWIYRGNLHPFDPSDWAVEPVTPLYTTPPRREWVGLTEEEIEAVDKTIDKFVPLPEAKRLYARAIETKLKEKNT